MWSRPIERRHFQWPWTTPTPSFKVTLFLTLNDHITDALVSLHWLRVPERIQYKIALYWATKFFTIPRRDTWDHSLVSPTYLIDEHSALPAPIAWKYLISNFPPSAAELFRLPPHRSGTHYQTQSFRHEHCGRKGRSSTNWKLFLFQRSFIY